MVDTHAALTFVSRAIDALDSAIGRAPAEYVPVLERHRNDLCQTRAGLRQVIEMNEDGHGSNN